MSAAAVGCDPLRDVRHRDARSARDQADWLAWLELGGHRPRTLRDYEWATARLLRALPDTAFGEFTASDIAHVLRSFPPAGEDNYVVHRRGDNVYYPVSVQLHVTSEELNWLFPEEARALAAALVKAADRAEELDGPLAEARDA